MFEARQCTLNESKSLSLRKIYSLPPWGFFPCLFDTPSQILLNSNCAPRGSPKQVDGKKTPYSQETSSIPPHCSALQPVPAWIWPGSPSTSI